jgi:hypothetical protein
MYRIIIDINIATLGEAVFLAASAAAGLRVSFFPSINWLYILLWFRFVVITVGTNTNTTIGHGWCTLSDQIKTWLLRR